MTSFGVRSSVTSVLVVLCVLCGLPLFAGLPEDTVELARTKVSDLAVEATPVEPWDAGSPQRLVRIEGVLHQEDAGFYYRVVEDRITVRLAGGVADWETLVNRANDAAPATFAGLRSLRPGTPNRLGILDLEIPAGADPAAWCELVFRSGLVEYAEVSTHGVYLLSPNDPQYDQQWALNNTGQTGGTPGADIRAEAAWELTTGDPAVIVAVLDSGTEVDHDDLAANVWFNLGEIAGNGTDDDGNGYVDDWEGWDFGNNNNDPRSSNFHGTHVTGIINAATHNGVGVSGLAGGFDSPGARAMAVAVGESGPNGAILDDAILYAADNGAQIITMSLSVGESSAINDALSYAYNVADLFIDCAAGNSGSSVGYPARRPEVVAVASTTDDDQRSSFSNPGPEVELAAPGSSIRSTQLNDSYGSSSGTSFAAPYVGALAALVRGLNPGLTAPEVRQLLIDSADDVESPGFDNLTGWGRINAFTAVSMTSSSDGTIKLDAERYSCSDNLLVEISDVDLAGSGTVTVMLRSNTEAVGEELILSETSSGSGRFNGTAVTMNGGAVADGILQISHNDEIRAEYVDTDDGQGGTGVLKLATADADCLPPVIVDVSATAIDDTRVEITWSTDEPGNSVVRYGVTPPVDDEISSPDMTAMHTVQISGLEPCTSYRFEVSSSDDVGNEAVDDNGGLYFAVETLGDFGDGLGPCHSGRVELDKTTYGCSGQVLVSVTDVDLGSDAGAAETTQVRVTSNSEPDGEWVTLTETGAESSRFEGTIELDDGVALADGVLAVSAGDLVTASYYDVDDGTGASRVATSASLTDCVAPEIRNVRVTAISATRAEIDWTTDEPATSRLEYGPTQALGSVVEDLALKTSHKFVLSPFNACDHLHFSISGADANGDVRVGDLGGVPFEFYLDRIGGLVYHDNFETADGWTLSGEWALGQPRGLGSFDGDPSKAYSGGVILGNDLDGEGAFPGDYEPSARESATSPAFDATGASNLELIYRRKLGIAGADGASIFAINSTPHAIWANSGSESDADWVEIRHDMSSADGSADLRIKFQLKSVNAQTSFGWNVDELIVKDATQPDYLACGGCATAPAFSGLRAAIDPDACAPTGLVLAWDAAIAWGTGGEGTYDVHRGTTPDFDPDAGNLVASGLTVTTWTDTNAPVDTAVWYVVRARNDEDCGGQGLTDSNVLRLSATETVAQSAPGDIGSSLRVDRLGDAHVLMDWSPAVNATRYRVLRGQSPDLSDAAEIGDTDGVSYGDANAATDGNLYFYRISPLNACGLP